MSPHGGPPRFRNSGNVEMYGTSSGNSGGHPLAGRSSSTDVPGFSAAACVCEIDSSLGRLGKSFIHFFLVGDQLLDARALQLFRMPSCQRGGRRPAFFADVFAKRRF
jgi:hypothetical protein